MRLVFFALVTTLILTGCFTHPKQPVSYYQFDSVVQQQKTDKLDEQTVLLVDKVQLNELYDQQALIQVLANNQVNIANFHFWAQPPSEMLTWQLIDALNQQPQQVALNSTKYYRDNQPHYRLAIELNEFAGHHAKGAIMTGSWYLYYFDQGRYQLHQLNNFSFTTPLQADGFSALVSAHQNNFAQLQQQLKRALKRQYE